MGSCAISLTFKYRIREFKWVIINLFNVAIIVIVLQAKGIFALFLNTLKAESYNISLQTLY